MNSDAIVVLFLLIFPASFSVAQEPGQLTTLKSLEKRLNNGGDTTFVVNLWATWCAPCVAEMPHFEQLQQRYSSEPLCVLFVSLDAPEKQEAVRSFVQAKGLKSEVWVLNEKDEQSFITKISEEWSGAIPATLFVNSGKGVRIFKEQEFNYKQLENSYLEIIH